MSASLLMVMDCPNCGARSIAAVGDACGTCGYNRADSIDLD